MNREVNRWMVYLTGEQLSINARQEEILLAGSVITERLYIDVKQDEKKRKKILLAISSP